MTRLKRIEVMATDDQYEIINELALINKCSMGQVLISGLGYYIRAEAGKMSIPQDDTVEPMEAE